MWYLHDSAFAYGEGFQAGTLLNGAFYEEGGAVAGDVWGSRREWSGSDAEGNFMEREYTFDGVYRARD